MAKLLNFLLAELEKKLAELQKFIKNEGENPPEWLSLESEEIKSPKVWIRFKYNGELKRKEGMIRAMKYEITRWKSIVVLAFLLSHTSLPIY